MVVTEHINVDFMEAYKRLDKLCLETYQCEKGITDYIDGMKRVSAYDSGQIPDWNTDLGYLIHLRHIRNQLTHDVGTFYMPMCEQSDIDYLEDFYNRISGESDPFAMLEKHGAAQQQQWEDPYDQQIRPSSPRGSFPRHLAAFLSALCSVGAIMLAILIWRWF